ncbi:hypothetical protein PG987_010785 [Apiospora arundinis]|uniref:Uncharacterized protein n=1 Tax=Apiospora arundinis TaxID=335852 RepID=A0ABR2ISC9_9PEZI
MPISIVIDSKKQKSLRDRIGFKHAPDTMRAPLAQLDWAKSLGITHSSVFIQGLDTPFGRVDEFDVRDFQSDFSRSRIGHGKSSVALGDDR